MAKAFSIASWNVEQFKEDPSRVDRIVTFLAAQIPTCWRFTKSKAEVDVRGWTNQTSAAAKDK